MSVNVNIILDKKSDILVVPTAAIHGTETRKTVQLYTNSKATAVPVEVGITDGKRTEITSGLEE